MFKVSRLPEPLEDEEYAVSTPEDHMDLEEDLGEGTSLSVARSVVSPGEVITSAKEYMR